MKRSFFNISLASCVLLLFTLFPSFARAQVKAISASKVKPLPEGKDVLSSGQAVSRDEIRKWCDSLSSRSFLERESATKQLTTSGFEVVPHLCDLILAGTPEQNWRATRILCQVGIEHQEEQVAKLTRVLFLLGTNGHPSLLEKSVQARARWKQHQQSKVIKRIHDLGGQVVGHQNGPANVMVERLGGIVLARSVETSAVGLSEDQKKRLIVPSNQKQMDTAQLRTEIDLILAAKPEDDAKALRKIKWVREETNAAQGKTAARVDGPFAPPVSANVIGATQAMSITLKKEWKGSSDDFRMLLDLPAVHSLHLEKIKVTNNMVDVMDHLALGSLQLIKCEFDSTRIRRFAKEHRNVFLNVRGKALLGVRGPIAAATVGNRQQEDETECEISEVIPNSSADKAGVKVGDCITHVDGNEITSFQELVYEIAGRQIGETVKLKIVRNEKTEMLELKLGDSADPKVVVDD